MKHLFYKINSFFSAIDQLIFIGSALLRKAQVFLNTKSIPDQQVVGSILSQGLLICTMG
jgi:hypothetical protein